MNNLHVVFPFFTGQLQTEMYFHALLGFMALFLMITVPFSKANRKNQSLTSISTGIGCLILITLLGFILGFAVFEYLIPGKAGGIMGFLLGYLALLEMMIKSAHAAKLKGMLTSMKIMLFTRRAILVLAVLIIFYIQVYQA
ncbi:hypothetical protein CZP2022_145 [Vibrio phage C-ZP2022]|nr:hypothetical protein CZP2022_145 [Vibrio phage C-ZP2022]